MPFRSALLRRALAAALVVGIAVPARAQTPDADAAAWRAELEALEAQIGVTDERRQELAAEVAAIDRDRAELNAALITTNQTVQDLERQIGEAEQRMAGLVAEEGRLRTSLSDRRDVLAEVLAVLQRMGRAPPPAIVVQPDDALAAVRSAILLGAVVPEMREEAEALAADIDGLVALRAEQEAERDRLVAGLGDLADETARLELLIAERQTAIAAVNENLATEEARAAGLAAQAGTLEELIAALDTPVVPPAAAAPLALRTEPGPPILLNDADRIAPAVPFGTARGRLPLPAAGRLVADFGADDGFGGRTAGLSVQTRASARVSAPADGWVEFAGSYRSYGNVLIIDAGDGYRIVLAGMERIDVQLGQFVLAGEPVAAMPAARVAAAAPVEMGTADPVLYVEFRRGDEAINPGPWWAEPY